MTMASRSARRSSPRAAGNESGQALVEVIIWSLLVIAMVSGIGVLFKYAENRQFAQNLVRYVLWERTVWSSPDHPWNGDANGNETVVQADKQLLVARGIERLSSPRSAVLSADKVTVDSDEGRQASGGRLKPWSVSTSEGRLMRLAANKVGAMYTSGMSPDIVKEEWKAPEHQLPGHILTNKVSIPGLSIDRGLQINHSMVTASIDQPLRDLYGTWQGLIPLPTHALGEDMGSAINLHVQGTILTNGWTVKNEKMFRRKIHDLDVRPLLTYFTYVSSQLNDATRIIPTFLKHFIPFLGPLSEAGNPQLHARTAMVPYERALPWHVDNQSGACCYSADDVPGDSEPGEGLPGSDE